MGICVSTQRKAAAKCKIPAKARVEPTQHKAPAEWKIPAKAQVEDLPQVLPVMTSPVGLFCGDTEEEDDEETFDGGRSILGEIGPVPETGRSASYKSSPQDMPSFEELYELFMTPAATQHLLQQSAPGLLPSAWEDTKVQQRHPGLLAPQRGKTLLYPIEEEDEDDGDGSLDTSLD